MNGSLNPHDLMHRFLAMRFLGYNNPFRFDELRDDKSTCGIDPYMVQSFDSYINNPQPFNTSGRDDLSLSSSLSRNAAIPICFRDWRTACEISRNQSLVTYRGLIGADCCCLLTFIVNQAIVCRGKKEWTLRSFFDRVGDYFCKYFPGTDGNVKNLACSKTAGYFDRQHSGHWNWKAPTQEYNRALAYDSSKHFGCESIDAMALALHVMYHTTSFEDAIIKAVNMCGYSSTVGAIVGQIAGAWYGITKIPKAWREVLREWDHDEIALRGYMLARLSNHQSYIISPPSPPSRTSQTRGKK